jgi:tRNA threonylcarbamoyladenosine biosynthesis protein TsaB
MRVLAIDTALAACSAAVWDSECGEPLACESQPMIRGHAEALLPLVARVMQLAECRFVDLDRIAVTTGPGSFTGLRVGIAAVRSMALVLKRPAIGITTLQAYAAPYFGAGPQRTAVAIDARHRHVYFQLFERDGSPVSEPDILRVEEAVSACKDAARVIGSGAPLLSAAWPSLGTLPLFDPQPAPDIAAVARLGAAACESSAPPKPLYIRRPDARPQDAAWIGRQ